MVWLEDNIWVESIEEYNERMKNKDLEKEVKKEIDQCERKIEYLEEILEQDKENTRETQVIEEGLNIEDAIEDESDKENGK